MGPWDIEVQSRFMRSLPCAFTILEMKSKKAEKNQKGEWEVMCDIESERTEVDPNR